MNTLLPKSEAEFSEVNYWDRFFKSRSKSFDWYGEYIFLVDLFNKYVKTQDDILVVGCGNSTLSYDLFVTQKCSKVCSIDISKTAINQMLLKHKKLICKITNKKQKAFDFKCLDVCQFSQDQDIQQLLPVSCVIDKGTTDAIHSGGVSSDSDITNMWTEIERNLALMGRYILITLAQTHIVDSIVEFFVKQTGNQWMINVHEICNSGTDDKSFSLPVFAFVFYKMKSSPSLPLVYIEENSFSKTGVDIKTEKKLLKDPKEQLKEWILSRQQLSILSHSIQDSKKEESVINMVSSQSGLVRYHCVLLRDSLTTKPKTSNQPPYCVFIVPFGLNNSNIINGPKQRLVIARDHIRSPVCLFVYLNPQEFYTSRQLIQDELHSVALKFCPTNVPKNYSIPFVSCDDLVYHSNVLRCGGDWLIESLETPDGDFCRLISASARRPVVIVNKAATVRDQLVSSYASLLPDMVEGSRGVFCGRVACSDVLDDKWKLLLTGCDLSVIQLVKEKLRIECMDSSVHSSPVDWVVYDCDVIDRDLVVSVLGRLTHSGIAVLCCDDVDGLRAVTANLPLPVVFSCETVESFGGDRTGFAILCSSSVNIASLRKVFSDLCGE